jgi:DNA polymerase/3'-5' exonuclease PolX
MMRRLTERTYDQDESEGTLSGTDLVLAVLSKNMNAILMRKMADQISAQLAPLCERIYIAGSLRRQRPVVNDIDLVILPRSGQQNAIKARCERQCHVVTDGPQNFIERLKNDVQLDIFFARPAYKDLLQTVPGNFGSLLVCRTGSKEHNIFMVEHAKRIGLVWKPYQGVFNGEGHCLAAEDEAGIFAALQLDYITPEKRER